MPRRYRWYVGVAVTIVGTIVVPVWLALRDDGSGPGPSTSTSVIDVGPRTTPRELPDLTDEVREREPPDPEPPRDDLPSDEVVVQKDAELPGQGDRAVAGDTVVFHCVGRVPDGTIFARSWDRFDQPASAVVGGSQPVPACNGDEDQVISVWGEALDGVRAGERLRLEVGADKAFGARGSDNGFVPPLTPVVFEVDILVVEAAA